MALNLFSIKGIRKGDKEFCDQTFQDPCNNAPSRPITPQCLADCRKWSFFGEAADGNVRTLSLIHAARVLIIVTIAPILLAQLFGIALNNPIGIPASTIPLHEFALMIIAALVGWKGGERIGLFGASILGPMVVAAMADLGFVITHHLTRIILVATGAPRVAKFFKVKKG